VPARAAAVGGDSVGTVGTEAVETVGVRVDAGGSRDAAVVVPAAGAGTRLGGALPKALCELQGEPLLAHATRRLLAAGSVGCLVVAAPAGYEGAVRDILDRVTAGPASVGASAAEPLVVVVTGGAERQQSVAAALARVPAGFEIILVHDAARALIPPTTVDAVAAAVRTGWDAVVPVVPVVDTITQVDPSGRSHGHLDRASLRAVQTPQGFRRAVLAEAHRRAAGPVTATDDAGLVARLGIPVHTVPGSAEAIKITTKADLAYAGTVLAAGRRRRTLPT
jgi:2-C-methyl-D-erythritol 4-phosphate cytidylyltransferase